MGSREVVFEVSNMRCQGCVTTIRRTLAARFGAVDVDADLDDHRVVVRAQSGLDVGGVQEALLEKGFDAQMIR